MPGSLYANTPLVVAAAASAPVVSGQAAFFATLRPLLDLSRPDDAAIESFYRTHGENPFWAGTAAGQALSRSLLAAEDHALPPISHNIVALAGRTGDARAELALMRAYLAHARDLSTGALNPRRVDRMIKRRSIRQDAETVLGALRAAVDIEAHLASLVPAHPDYGRLQRRYAALRAAPQTGAPMPRIARGPTLRPGASGPRVIELRESLEALGRAPVGTAADPAFYDTALEAAVRRFQSDQGLNADGLVGSMTRAALNIGPAAQMEKLAVNMERLRWTNMPFGHRHIRVNQADFTVQLIENDRVLFDERAVIGRNDRQTPEFSDEMEHLVFNPTWYVPRSIATKDILPKLLEDPGYLARSNMVLTRADGGPMPVDTAQHDFSAYTADDFPFGIRQHPSAGNALGEVKFMFPNNHAIYLHDTPSRNLFLRDRRAYSSGCVRVRDPLRLAALLLAPQVGDPARYIDRLLESGRERYVHLDRHVPVHLTYRTATVDDFGELRFRADVYGRDAKVAAALREAGVSLPLR